MKTHLPPSKRPVQAEDQEIAPESQTYYKPIGSSELRHPTVNPLEKAPNFVVVEVATWCFNEERQTERTSLIV